MGFFHILAIVNNASINIGEQIAGFLISLDLCLRVELLDHTVVLPGGGHGNPLQCSCLEIPHGQRSLAGCSPWGRKESDRTERQHARTLLIWDLGTRFTCVHFRTFKLSEIKFQRAREVIFPEGGHMASTWPQGASGPRWPVQPSTG